MKEEPFKKMTEMDALEGYELAFERIKENFSEFSPIVSYFAVDDSVKLDQEFYNEFGKIISKYIGRGKIGTCFEIPPISRFAGVTDYKLFVVIWYSYVSTYDLGFSFQVVAEIYEGKIKYVEAGLLGIFASGLRDLINKHKNKDELKVVM
jgi:hypothetical protein